MSTLYDLFKVTEKATQEEIKTAYEKILEKANSMPQTEKNIEQTRRVKIAYGILSDPEKRKKYDLDLATKRADELLQNVQVQKEEPLPEISKDVDQEGNIVLEKVSENKNESEQSIPQIDEEKLKQSIESQIDNMAKKVSVRDLKANADKKRMENQIQKQEYLKQQKKQEKKARRQAKKDQQLKREMEIQAYGSYLSKQGYKVKYPWTWLRVKRLLITILATIIVFVIAWQIPYVRNVLTNLYHDNFIVKAFVDIVVSLFKAIFDAIKGIFK